MELEQYKVFEPAFLEGARECLEGLRRALGSCGFVTTEVQVMNRENTGMEFSVVGQPDFFVELMLEDGAEHGYEGVGLVMNCSIFFSGQIWAPGNFTESVSILNVDELRLRLASFDPAAVVQEVVAEWERARLITAAEANERPVER